MGETRQNSYFFIDEQNRMEVMCVSCHDKEPDKGWFWDGVNHGYGPFDFICCVCGHVIHRKPGTGEGK